MLQKQNDPPPKAGTPEYFNYNDTYGHGTHVAGIIGAIGNNKQVRRCLSAAVAAASSKGQCCPP